MTQPDHTTPQHLRLRLLAAVLALAAGVIALVVAIQLVRGVLG
jgi:hypothetical protein